MKMALEKQKAGKKDWTEEHQSKLDAAVMSLVDIEEALEAKEHVATYVPKKGTEKMVHLSIVRGRRFNPNTGKEESKPYIQMFTYSEWTAFKNNYKSLGFVIMSVLHDPYNEAAGFVNA